MLLHAAALALALARSAVALESLPPAPPSPVRVSRLRPLSAPHTLVGTALERYAPGGVEVAVGGGGDDEWYFALAGDRSASLGGTVWPSAAAAACLLRGKLRPFLRGRSVLELGSGLGLAGLAAAAAGAETVTLTDSAPELLDTLDDAGDQRRLLLRSSYRPPAN